MDEETDGQKEIFNPSKNQKDSERYKASLSKEVIKYDITTQQDIYEEVKFVTTTIEENNNDVRKKGKGKKERTNSERVLDNRDKEIEEKEARDKQLADIEKARELAEQQEKAQAEKVDVWVPNQ